MGLPIYIKGCQVAPVNRSVYIKQSAPFLLQKNSVMKKNECKEDYFESFISR